MSARRVAAIAAKEFIHIYRDPRSLIMAIAIPAMLLVLYGFALSLDLRDIRTVIMLYDSSPEAVAFVDRFRSSGIFEIRKRAFSYAEIEDAVGRGRCMLAMIIPADFSRAIKAGRRVDVQFIVDGSNASIASTAIGYVRMLVSIYNAELIQKRTGEIGARKIRMPVEPRVRVWFNPELKSRNFIIPGLIAVIMMVIAALLTSLTVAREWENGTMEQLIASPMRTGELIAGKMIPYFTLAFLDISVAVIMGRFLFRVPLRGSLLLLFGTASVFLVGTLSMGLLISIATRSQMLANQLAIIVTFLPSFLLSDFVFSIDNMPKAVQLVTYAVPARYMVRILKSVFLKGVGMEILWLDALSIAVFSLIVFVIATRLMVKFVD